MLFSNKDQEDQGYRQCIIQNIVLIIISRVTRIIKCVPILFSSCMESLFDLKKQKPGYITKRIGQYSCLKLTCVLFAANIRCLYSIFTRHIFSYWAIHTNNCKMRSNEQQNCPEIMHTLSVKQLGGPILRNLSLISKASIATTSYIKLRFNIYLIRISYIWTPLHSLYAHIIRIAL